jgi:hypothetical protein
MVDFGTMVDFKFCLLPVPPAPRILRLLRPSQACGFRSPVRRDVLPVPSIPHPSVNSSNL